MYETRKILSDGSSVYNSVIDNEIAQYVSNLRELIDKQIGRIIDIMPDAKLDYDRGCRVNDDGSFTIKLYWENSPFGSTGWAVLFTRISE